MNFLNPLVLWALPFAGGPLLLHLLMKRPSQSVMFSHIAWLKQIHQSVMPRKHIRDLLLLIIRTCIILALILFFSRPVFQNQWLQTQNQEAVTVILVDLSVSMGTVTAGQTSLDLGKAMVQNILRRMSLGSRVGVIGFSDKVELEVAPTVERSIISSAIGNLKLTSRTSEISPAVQQAFNMLNSQVSDKKSILIISDQAQNVWELLKKEGRFGDHFDPNVAIVAYECAPLSGNSGISEAALQLNEEGVLKGHWIYHNYEPSVRMEPWDLKLNGKGVNQGIVSGDREKNKSVSLEAQLPKGGYYAGQITKKSDNALFDDVYFLAGRVPSGFRLLIVDGEGGLAPSDSEIYYLKSALESPRDPRVDSIRVIRPETLLQEDFSLYDVIVLANVGDFSGRETDLKIWIEKGGGLFISAGGHWPKINSDPLGLVRPIGKISEKLNLKTPDLQTPFLKNISGITDFQWDQMEVRHSIRLEEDSSSISLLNLTNNAPILIRKQLGAGFVLCWLTSVDRSWTNFPAKPIFAPLVRELIATLADPLREQSALNGFVGKPFQIRIPLGIKTVSIVSPDGTSMAASASNQGLLDCPSPSSPGLYEVITEKKENNFYFAINIPNVSEEGNPKRFNENDLKNIFKKSPVSWISYDSDGGEAIISALQGKDLTSFFLYLVFIFIAAEFILIWPRPIKTAFSFVFIVLLALPSDLIHGGNGNRFVYAQLKHSGAWDPYPHVEQRILQSVKQMTNIPFLAEKKVVTLMDKTIFENPFLLVQGNSALVFNPEEKRRLKQFVERGGFVFFDDSLADVRGPFSESVRTLMSDLYPDKTFQKLTIDHALFRSFFLLRNIAGRKISGKSIEGMDVSGNSGGEGRTAVILCSNDLIGSWMRDNFGEYLFTCEPGGETQRWESMKLTINIIYFSLTGTYKRDAIHQPFIEKKLGS